MRHRFSFDFGTFFSFVGDFHGSNLGHGILTLYRVVSPAEDGAEPGPYGRDFDSVDDRVDEGVGEREDGTVHEKLSFLHHRVVVQVALQVQDDNDT